MQKYAGCKSHLEINVVDITNQAYLLKKGTYLTFILKLLDDVKVMVMNTTIY